MATVTTFQSVSLDGVTQGIGRPDEDTRDGFKHGGWGDCYVDEVSMSSAAEGMAQHGALLFGRRTYEDLLGYWTCLDDRLTHSVPTTTGVIIAHYRTRH